MKLGDVCQIKYGKDHKALPDGAIPVYGSGGIMRYCDKYIHNKQSVLIPRKGTLSNIFYVDQPFWTVDTLFWTDINEEIVLPKYLYYLLLTKNLSSLNVGTAVPSLTADILNDIQITLPSLSIQKKIVKVLSSFDDKIKLNKQLNDYLEQCLLARYDELFGESCPYDGTIADIGDVIGGATPSKKKPEYYNDDGIGWITPRDLSNTADKFVAHGADDISQLGFNSCSVKMLPVGTVLFSSRAPIGYIAIATDNVTTNQGFKSIVPHPEIGTAFTYCFLKRNKDRIADAGSGTTFPEVSGKTMAGIELTMPDAGLCAEFSAWAKPFLDKQCCLETENRKLGKLRDTLLPKLMSGEIDVSEVELHTQPNNH